MSVTSQWLNIFWLRLKRGNKGQMRSYFLVQSSISGAERARGCVHIIGLDAHFRLSARLQFLRRSADTGFVASLSWCAAKAENQKDVEKVMAWKDERWMDEYGVGTVTGVMAAWPASLLPLNQDVAARPSASSVSYSWWIIIHRCSCELTAMQQVQKLWQIFDLGLIYDQGDPLWLKVIRFNCSCP